MAARAPLSRRALLGLAGLGAVLAACGEDEASEERRIRYGDAHPDQFGRLGLPDGDPVGVAVLVHGGFWLDQYGLDLMDPLAADLRERGWATWNIEYRRLGAGGGYPETFADVAAAFDAIPTLGPDPDLPTASVGHSAGGHLAVWAASRTRATPGGPPRRRVTTTMSLSGVLCLADADRQGLGNGAATELMGDRYDGSGSSYDLADPFRLAPAAGRVLAVHAADDRLVPPAQSADYVAAAEAAGGDAELVTVPGGHFDLIDPASEAWTTVADRLRQ